MEGAKIGSCEMKKRKISLYSYMCNCYLSTCTLFTYIIDYVQAYIGTCHLRKLIICETVDQIKKQKTKNK